MEVRKKMSKPWYQKSVENCVDCPNDIDPNVLQVWWKYMSCIFQDLGFLTRFKKGGKVTCKTDAEGNDFLSFPVEEISPSGCHIADKELLLGVDATVVSKFTPPILKGVIPYNEDDVCLSPAQVLAMATSALAGLPAGSRWYGQWQGKRSVSAFEVADDGTICQFETPEYFYQEKVIRGNQALSPADHLFDINNQIGDFEFFYDETGEKLFCKTKSVPCGQSASIVAHLDVRSTSGDEVGEDMNLGLRLFKNGSPTPTTSLTVGGTSISPDGNIETESNLIGGINDPIAACEVCTYCVGVIIQRNDLLDPNSVIEMSNTVTTIGTLVMK